MISHCGRVNQDTLDWSPLEIQTELLSQKTSRLRIVLNPKRFRCEYRIRQAYEYKFPRCYSEITFRRFVSLHFRSKCSLGRPPFRQPTTKLITSSISQLIRFQLVSSPILARDAVECFTKPFQKSGYESPIASVNFLDRDLGRFFRRAFSDDSSVKALCPRPRFA